MNSPRPCCFGADRVPLRSYHRGVLISLLIVLFVAALAAVVVLTVRYRRLDSDVDRILGRLEIASSSKVSSRALYRGVRGLERRLEESEQTMSRLQAIAEQSDIGLVIAAEAGEVVYANPAAQKVLSGRLGDAVAGTRIVALLERVQRTGIEEDLELDLYTPTRKIVGLRAVPLTERDGVGGAVGYIQDLSGRRRVEAMRRDFLTNAGHEMKTPIGALSVLAETIAETEDPEIRRRLAGRMRTEANRMAHVVDDILMLADIESLETPYEPVPIRRVVDEAVARAQPAASERGVTIEVGGAGFDTIVDGNVEHLVSAIANLLDNAVKYTDPDRDSTVEIEVSSDQGSVTITVRDQGIGIGGEHIDRVFERFYRVDRGRNRSSGGTGLGLSIVNNVVRTHGGSVEVESVPAEGSVFRITLPERKEGSDAGSDH